MEEKINILGCYVSSMNGDDNGDLFRQYIWGEKGICDTLKNLKHKDYGKDMMMILFEFYVNPIPYLEQNLKVIDSYRKNEKSIGLRIVVNDKNFFSKSEEGRYSFLKQSIFQKLDLLEEVVKKKKLDTKMDLLKSDLEKLLY